jgi:methionine-R-sulfoxide reductase
MLLHALPLVPEFPFSTGRGADSERSVEEVFARRKRGARAPRLLSSSCLAEDCIMAQTPLVKVKVYNRAGRLVGPVEIPKVVKSDKEWSAQLSAEQFQVARGKGTERPFCGTLLDNKRQGVYACVCCGLPLFTSEAKFHSGTGWPSFFQPVAEENVITHTDRSFGMVRSEILCARCDGHLGHVFPDGPPPTSLRYCVNSESLVFTDQQALASLADAAAESAVQPS